jgi:dienelactone hydrolase
VWRPVDAPGARITLGELGGLVRPAAGADRSPCLGEGLSSAAGEPLFARLDGTPAAGRRPLVVLSGGLNSAGLELASLAETLASHGYVVAAVLAPPGDSPRAFDARHVELARAAIAATIERLSRDDGVDDERVALGAWSFGGAPATLEALARPSVRALVSLDSALRYQYGAALIRDARGYVPAAYRGALLSVIAGVDNEVAKDEGVLDAMSNATRTRHLAPGMSHAPERRLGTRSWLRPPLGAGFGLTPR